MVIVSRHEVIKSPEDARQYRGLTLQNQLKVLLISDPDTDKAAAAMDVNVGHMNDPQDLPGLAHFLEHMLFMGTSKYPDEEEYHNFLNLHGGHSNAYTADDHTNFYFDVIPNQLAAALDRFAQFFICPLFTESATDREVKAVNSEHEQNFASDLWRLDQLHRSLADDNHDYRKFGTGSSHTLQDLPKQKGLDVRAALLEFHQKWYSANLMALTVVGKESLDDLEVLVTELISMVENKKVAAPLWTEHPFQRCLSSITYCVPIKDLRNCHITFPIPDLSEHYKSCPVNYLSHLMGHEGRGSLLSELKARSWANSLVCGLRSGAKGFSFITFNIGLTEVGLENTDEIILMVFQYIEMVRRVGIQEWFFNECKDINAMLFRFSDKSQPARYASSLAEKMHDFPMDDLLTVGYIFTDWKPELVDMVLQWLVPERAVVMVVGQKFQQMATQTEPWFGTKYETTKLRQDQLEAWRNCGLNDKFFMPEKNPFITTDFELAPREPDDGEMAPRLIHQTPLFSIWFKQDNEFNQPKACMRLKVQTPLANIDPHHSNLMAMWLMLVKDDINEESYMAVLAGLDYNLYATQTGFSLSLNGYQEKQLLYLAKILTHLTQFQPSTARFESLKEAYVRALNNHFKEQPKYRAMYVMHELLVADMWTVEEKIQVLAHLTLDEVLRFCDSLFRTFGLFIEVLMYGNLTVDAASALKQLLEDKFATCRPLTPSQRIRVRELMLPENSNLFFEAKTDVHTSSCIHFSLQCGIEQLKTHVLLKLYEQIIRQPCFDTLRTKEQLGYVVSSQVMRRHGVHGLSILIQSSRKPDFLDKRIETFLVTTRQKLTDMSPEEFEDSKEGLSKLILEKPTKMSSRAAMFWAEIVDETYCFDRSQRMADQLQLLSKDDVIDFHDTYIAPGSRRRRKLATHIVSTLTNQQPVDVACENSSVDIECASLTEITDVVAFKTHSPLWPCLKPWNVDKGLLS